MINLLLFVIGVIIIILQINLSNNKCPPEKIIYQYVPRTFKEEQMNPIKSSEIFRDMFEKPSILS